MGEEKIRLSLAGMLGTVEIDKWAALKLCNEVLSGVIKSDILDELMHYPPLRASIIQILREKFRVNIRCGNCRFLQESPEDPKHARGCTKDGYHPDRNLTAKQYWLRKEENLDDYCLYWQPKEVSENGSDQGGFVGYCSRCRKEVRTTAAVVMNTLPRILQGVCPFCRENISLKKVEEKK